MWDFIAITPPTTFFTDFNSLTGDGLVKCSRAMARIIWLPLEVGQRVLLEDGEQNTCYGTVVTVEFVIVRVRPDWETWAPGPILTTAQSKGDER